MAEYSRNDFRITPNSEQIPIQVCGSSTFGRYQKIGSGLTYNMFISEGWLINFAGFKKFVQVIAGNSPCRGLYRSVRGDILMVAVGAVLYKVDQLFNVTNVGTLQTGSGEIFMDENLNGQICIVDGLRAYIYNYGNNTLTVQTGGPLTGVLIPNYVTFHNTFFLFGNGNNTGDGARWYAYKYDTPTTITAQTEFALSTKPDTAIAVKRLPGQANNVLVFGRTVCEIWTAVGGLQNYRRNSSVNIDYGCLSVSTIASGGDYTAWLATNEDNKPAIMVFTGQGTERISTDGIDYLLARLNHPEDSTALFYRQDGHLFYQLTFYHQDDNMTLTYDFNTQKFFNLSDYDNTFHPARDMVYFQGKLLFASLKNSCLYESSTTITSYNENLTSNVANMDPNLIHMIPRARVCESIRKPDSGRFIANSFVFTMAQGEDPKVTGISKAQPQPPIGYRPRIDMAISKDSGITWSSTVSRELNPIAKRENIITFNNLGRANDLTIKLFFYGLSSFVATDGFIEAY